MNKSNLAGIIIDCQTKTLTQAAHFWSQALGYPLQSSSPPADSKFIAFDTGPNGLTIEVQSVDHPSRVHIDLKAADVEAEVTRLETLGATRVQQFHDWCVMEAPTGHRFCVVPHQPLTATHGALTLCPVDESNWRALAAVELLPQQQQFVNPPTYYLSLCHYGNEWKPLAINHNEQVIGMMIWDVDPADGACWFGGIQIDHRQQRKGYAQQAIQLAITMLNQRFGYKEFALSYQPANPAKALYKTLGFIEQDEWEDDEVVARLQYKK